MRLGDLDALKDAINFGISDAPTYIKATVDQYIDEAPTIDTVPVVRCRECSKKDKNTCPLVFVQFDRNMKQVLVQKPVPDDFFCSCGQRKEADHEISES